MPNSKFADMLNNRPKSSAVRENSSTRRLDGALFVPIVEVVPNPKQVRQIFDDEKEQELAADIKERGVLEPLLVRKDSQDKYEIIAGERRYRAAQLAGLTELPVIVKNIDDQEARFMQLAENLQRQDLDPRDEKSFFETLMAEYNLTQEEIAKLINKSRGYVSKRLSGSLKIMQPETELFEADSEISNNMLHESSKLKKSQSENAKNKNNLDTAMKRLGQALNNLTRSLQLEELPQDKEMLLNMQQNIEQLEQQLLQVKEVLAKASGTPKKRTAK